MLLLVSFEHNAMNNSSQCHMLIASNIDNRFMRLEIEEIPKGLLRLHNKSLFRSH